MSWSSQLSDNETSKNSIAQLNTALEAINKLIAEVAERRAILDVQDAIKGVSFIEKSSPAKNPLLESTLEHVSSLEALVPDLDAFSSGLEKLEEEYFRLEAEKEIEAEF